MDKRIKITVYTTSEFMGNVIAHEGKLVDCGYRNYAQYTNVPFVDFTPKGRRKVIRFVKGYNPYLVVVKGWGHPAPADMVGKALSQDEVPGGTVVVQQSTYKSFDAGWTRDFDAVIDAYLTKARDSLVVLDCRYTKGTK